MPRHSAAPIAARFAGVPVQRSLASPPAAPPTCRKPLLVASLPPRAHTPSLRRPFSSLLSAQAEAAAAAGIQVPQGHPLLVERHARPLSSTRPVAASSRRSLRQKTDGMTIM